jgi:hypothetical protein
MDDPVAPLSTDEVMREIGARVRQRLRERLTDPHPDDPLGTPDVFAQTEAILRRAAEPRRSMLLPALVVDEYAWRLQTSLKLHSHRRFGGVVVAVKRRLLLPLSRWLYEFCRDNFARQQHVNDTLAGCVESLAVEIVLLRRELERLRAEGQRGSQAG